MQELGRGGMGVVYQAWHPGLKSYFAVKVLLAGSDASAEEIKRFHREAEASARLKHPGIVAVHDVDEEEGKTYFAMEYVEGMGLDKILADPLAAGLAPAAPPPGRAGQKPTRRWGLNASTAVQMTQEIAEAISAAHDAGVIHRDLKPANVIRDRNGRLRVMDFGLAKLVDAGKTGATRTGAVMGTPACRSPEQAEGRVRDVDALGDVYQLGAILYELLTGRPPYDGDSALDILLKVLQEDPVPPRRVNPRIPRDADTICLKALARGRDQRYASARALAGDCGRLLAGEAIRARREAWWEKAARWSRRRKAAVGLGSALLLTLAIAGGARWETARIRREQEGLQREMLAKASSAVLRYENTVMSVRLDAAGRRALAEQPLETLALLLERQPDFGPLYSWRGTTKALIGATQKEMADAEADLDIGCALAPGRAVVWFLRGMHHLDIYASSRALPGATLTGNDVAFAPPTSEGAGDSRRREQGLADLERMLTEAWHDPAFGDEEVRLGQAMAALHRGGDAEYHRVLGLLEGIERPKATRLKGLALHYLKRFEESAAALNRTRKAWPEDAATWHYLASVEHSAALLSSARGGDPREGYGKAITALGEALRRNPEDAVAYINHRGGVYQSLGQAEAARGLDPQPSLRKAEADYRAALTRHSPKAYLNLGLLCRTQRRFDEAIAAFEAGARALPGYAAWAQARIAETRALQQAATAPATAPAPADPWAREFARAGQAVQTGDYAAARTRYEQGLALLAESLRSLSDAERTQRLADPAARAALIDAHYDLACILPLAAVGRAGRNAPLNTHPPACATPPSSTYARPSTSAGPTPPTCATTPTSPRSTTTRAGANSSRDSLPLPRSSPRERDSGSCSCLHVRRLLEYPRHPRRQARMCQIELSIPDESLAALKVTPIQAGEEIRMAAAMKLFELGRLSSGAAARLAGVPRTLFLVKLADYGVTTFRIGADELREETRLA